MSDNRNMFLAILLDMGKVFKGVKWKPADYRDLLCLLFELIRLARTNPVGLEEHIEKPGESADLRPLCHDPA